MLAKEHPQKCQRLIRVLRFLKDSKREHFVQDYWRNETRSILGDYPVLYKQSLEILEIFDKRRKMT